MSINIELPNKVEDSLCAQAQAQGLDLQEYVVQLLSGHVPVDDASINRPIETQAGKKSVSSIVREIWSDLPEDARAMLPADGASQVDHYVYGTPKRDQ